MAWYYILAFGLLIGFALGYATKDLISPEIVIKGKIKQKGKGNSLTVKPNIEVKKQRRKRMLRRNKKEHRN